MKLPEYPRSLCSALLAILTALATFSGFVGSEAHQSLFHGSEGLKAHCTEHEHSDWTNAEGAGIDHPACVSHPPIFTSRLFAVLREKLIVIPRIDSGVSTREVSITLTIHPVFRSRAPPASA